MYWQNFRQYWKEQLTHAVVGLTAGLLLTLGYPTAGLVVMGTVAVRQGLEFAKRNDTPGIDLAYHLIGLLSGIGIGVLI